MSIQMDGLAKVFNGGPRRSSDENLEAATNQTIAAEIIVDEACGGNKRRRGKATKTAEEKTAINTENRRMNRKKEKESLKEFKEKCENQKNQIYQLQEENMILNRNLIAHLSSRIEDLVKEVGENKAESREIRKNHTKLLSMHKKTTKDYTSLRQEYDSLKNKYEDQESDLKLLTIQLDLYKDIANANPSDMLLDTNMNNPPQNQN